MGTPVDERAEHELAESQRRLSFSADGREQLETSLPAYNIHNQQTGRRMSQEKSSDGEKTVVHEGDTSQIKDTQPVPRHRGMSHLTIPTITDDFDPGDPLRQLQSPSQSREQANRLNDDLAFLQVERQVSRQAAENEERSRSRVARSRVRDEHIDEFDEATNPVHEQAAAVYRPLDQPLSKFGKLVKQIHASVWFVRYIAYIAPLTLILLIPLLLGFTLFPTSTVGGVYLPWFMIWLEIVWLTLWLGRIIAKCLPWPIGVVSSLFTNNSKKWRDMGKQLELPATLFFWWLAIEVSFIPTLTNHQNNGHDSSYIPTWMVTMNKVLVSIFVGACLNFIEKVIIQLIAISFHLRTYADRIEINKFQIGSLVKLYVYSKEKIAMEDHEFETPSGPASGARTPGQLVSSAAKTTREAFSKFGDIAGAVAGDFTGKKIIKSTHPNQVILALLNSVSGSQVLARRLYRTFAREETQTVLSDDLKPAFDNDEEASAAFSMFDKDLNGDISMEELEAVCVEIGRERKSITASLKDLDSVVGKLDDVFMFIVLIITVLVFISLISTSAAGVLTSAGSAVLALSWLFSATAQEFLQSCIFVFVKHPFDVGDRVTVYGNTGSALKGDDYFVKEISLLYTEFKKMEGHIVQAPNSYLNTLFILNQRRSGGLAEALTLTIKFGTTLQQIEGLRNKLLDFVREEKREYQNNILTELRNITDVHSMDLNIVFFYKSNWQNEGLRLARRNKFLCALMIAFQELGIEGPQMRYPGMRQSFPVYLQNIPHVGVPGADHGHGGHPDNPMGFTNEKPFDEPFVAPPVDEQVSDVHPRGGSLLRNPRARGESIAAMNRRVDLSLGMSAMASSDLGGNVYDDRTREQIPIQITQASQSRARAADAERRRESEDIARVTSRDIGPSNLMRRSTDRSSIHPRQSLHRNRFLSRRAGNADQQSAMENGMADIPEATGMSTPATARIDPRSGLVSAAAWRVNTNDSNIGSNSSLDKEGFNNYEFHAPTRSGTENMEMKQL